MTSSLKSIPPTVNIWALFFVLATHIMFAHASTTHVRKHDGRQGSQVLQLSLSVHHYGPPPRIITSCGYIGTRYDVNILQQMATRYIHQLP